MKSLGFVSACIGGLLKVIISIRFQLNAHKVIHIHFYCRKSCFNEEGLATIILTPRQKAKNLTYWYYQSLQLVQYLCFIILFLQKKKSSQNIKHKLGNYFFFCNNYMGFLLY